MRIPASLAGIIPQLWEREPGRFGSAPAGLAALVGLHSWEGGQGGRLRTRLSHDRLSKLLGVDRKTLMDPPSGGGILHYLAHLGLIRYGTEANPAGRGRSQWVQALPKLGVRNGEEWAQYPAELFYGGHWAALPDPARQLLFTIHARQQVRDPKAYGNAAADASGAHPLEGYRRRAERGWTVQELREASGLGAESLAGALRALLAPVLAGKSRAYLESGDSGGGEGRRWYALASDLAQLAPPLGFDVLNQGGRAVREARAEVFGAGARARLVPT